MLLHSFKTQYFNYGPRNTGLPAYLVAPPVVFWFRFFSLFFFFPYFLFIPLLSMIFADFLFCPLVRSPLALFYVCFFLRVRSSFSLVRDLT